jgi:hypothetical protein
MSQTPTAPFPLLPEDVHRLDRIEVGGARIVFAPPMNV